MTVAALFLAAALRGPTLHVPAVVALRADVARARILRLLPGSHVIVKHSYSTRVAQGRVISQRPHAKALLGHDEAVRLVVSNGTPFATVPIVTTGVRPAAARAALARTGFDGRYWYEPSWTVGKGTVIGLWPAGGTRLRRPARVTIVVASGYPRSVVPDLLRTDSVSAESQLRAKHLQFRIVYRLAPPALANQVLAQTPAAGRSVLQGTRVELTVARTLRWVRVLTSSGSSDYLSRAFTAPKRWRIRYRLGAGDLGFALAQIGWSPDGALFGTAGFTAHDSNRLDTRIVTTPGTYRLSISPYLGTTWHVEIDALE